MGPPKNTLKRRAKPLSTEAERSQPPCPHATLVPHWDSIADIGNPKKVTYYTCRRCKTTFSFQDGKKLKAR
jgi:hypothetical protein